MWWLRINGRSQRDRMRGAACFAVVFLAVTSVASAQPASPLIDEGFESTLSGWTEEPGAAPGTLNDDDTTSPSPLYGAESLRITTPVAAGARMYKDFTGGDERWAYFLFRPVSTTNNWTIFSFWDSGFAEVCVITLQTANTLQAEHGGATGSSTVGTLSDGTTYHVWIHYNDTTDVCDVGFSTDGVRPTSGDNFVSDTGGTVTTDAQKIVLGGGASDSSEIGIFDRVYVDDAQIGDFTAGGSPTGARLLLLGVGTP